MGKTNQIETILISELALPYSKTGSWTTMYNSILDSGSHHFDYIICPEPKIKANSCTYTFVKSVNTKDKLVKKIIRKNNDNSNYIDALKAIVKPNVKYVVQIIDNTGLVIAVHKVIDKHFNRANFFIQHCYHGFLPIQNKSKSKLLFKAVDEIIFLTGESYKAFLNAYDALTFTARVIHNGINLEKFKHVSTDKKQALRNQHNVSKDAFVFIWCSHSRPKKGLHIAIEAFKQLQKETNAKLELLVIGVNHKIEDAGIISVGHIPNDAIVKYYQMADVFLFPSLWQEGFGIVLAEALHSGCYVIASNRGGIKEVLANGKYGVLIDKPNIISEWVSEMHKAIQVCAKHGNPFKSHLPKDAYSLENWSKELNASIIEAKQRLGL
jgi:glycosyltransferase involved in cell wall biosynthesis